MSSYTATVDISIDEIDDLESRVSSLESLNTCGKDINNLVDEDQVQSIVNEAVSSYLIDNQDFVSEDRVQDMIDTAVGDLPGHDDILNEDDVRRIADEAISEADSTLVDELERRVDRYAQKLDALISGTQGMGTDTAVLEAQVLALSEDVGRKAEQVRILQSRVDAMEALQVRLKVTDTLTQHQGRIASLEARLDALINGTQGIGTDTAVLEARLEVLTARINDSTVKDGVTLLDLLRRAYSIIVGGRA
jgi:hypothetical protein